jgi:hypothetical protein
MRMKSIGVSLERYQVPVGTRPIFPNPPGWTTGGEAHRFWVHEKVLVGGTILDAADGEHLKKTYEITDTLSFEHEHTDWNKGFEPANMCWTPFIDHGQEPHPELLDQALAFAFQVLRRDGTLYAHCQLGGSRGPTAGYLVCVGILGMRREDVLSVLKRAHRGGSEPHGPYLQACDEAIARWRSKWIR